MKRLFLFFSIAVITMGSMTSCESVDSGHTGVAVQMGATDTTRVYPEGFYFGIKWLYTDMVPYETREITVKMENDFLDRDNLSVPVAAVMYYQPMPNKVNWLHKTQGPDYMTGKIEPIFAAALKNVIPKYKVLELNVDKRDEADKELHNYLEAQLATINCRLIRVNITDLDIPDDIKRLVIQKQSQDEANSLAMKKRNEQVYLGQARVAKDSLNYIAAAYEAKTKDVLSQPKMLELKRLEIEDKYAEGFVKHGGSRYGTNNFFGAETSIVKGLK